MADARTSRLEAEVPRRRVDELGICVNVMWSRGKKAAWPACEIDIVVVDVIGCTSAGVWATVLTIDGEGKYVVHQNVIGYLVAIIKEAKTGVVGGDVIVHFTVSTPQDNTS